MERNPDCRDQGERGERRHHRGDGDQQHTGNARCEPTASDAARHAEAKRHVREQVESRAAAESERLDRAELISEMLERALHREREEHDARDHRQVQVGVDVAGDRNALLAAAFVQQLPSPNREEVEVGQPERHRDEEPEERGDDHVAVEPLIPRSEPDRN